MPCVPCKLRDSRHLNCRKYNSPDNCDSLLFPSDRHCGAQVTALLETAAHRHTKSIRRKSRKGTWSFFMLSRPLISVISLAKSVRSVTCAMSSPLTDVRSGRGKQGSRLPNLCEGIQTLDNSNSIEGEIQPCQVYEMVDPLDLGDTVVVQTKLNLDGRSGEQLTENKQAKQLTRPHQPNQ